MNIKMVLSIIDTIRDGFYCPPLDYYIKKDEFIQKSYQMTGLKEIKLYLIRNKNKDPLLAIEDFRKEMDDFSCIKNDIMFSVYYDTATFVLDILLNMTNGGK